MNVSNPPEVRTKVANLRADYDELFFELLESLRRGEISSSDYQSAMRKTCRRLDLHDAFGDVMQRVDQTNEAEVLLRRHVDDCRYTVQVYKMEASSGQPPHQHHNLISTHVVLSGFVHLREYQRVGWDNDNAVLLKPVRDDVIASGDLFQASEWTNNVHWFGAVGGPALMFSVDARGYERATFNPQDTKPFGRRYLDPTTFKANGNAVGVELCEAEAKRQFAHRRLSDFPMPSGDTG